MPLLFGPTPPALQAPAPALPHVAGFEVRSAFWLNLHHTLFAQAFREAPRVKALPDPARFTAEERAAWERALSFYRARFPERDLLFDRELTALKEPLGAADPGAPLTDPALPADLREALNLAAPCFRREGWPAQAAANRAFVEALGPKAARFGPELQKELARLFHGAWPTAPIRLDLSYYANWAGAYTSLAPSHIVLSSGDPRGQGDAALESLFHEAAHLLEPSLMEGLDQVAKAQGRALPPNLWHALIFYTVGERVARRLPGHRPYAEVQNLYPHLGRGMKEALDQHWKPWVEGKGTFEGALAVVLKALPE